MGWRGLMRSMAAAARQADREERRRQRELAMQQKQMANMARLERARYEVQVYENLIEVLRSVHKECGRCWDWSSIRSSTPPAEPGRYRTREVAAQAAMDGFEPGLTDRLFGRVERKRKELSRVAAEAIEADERDYQESVASYRRQYAEWESAREMADRILSGDTDAYIDALKQSLEALSEIHDLGLSVVFRPVNRSLLIATLRVKGEDSLPSETKRLLKSGKLSVSPMPKTGFHQLYQDYICSCVLRVAREMFALLPVEMVLVNAVGNLLNASTGRLEDQPVLSAMIPRRTLDGFNFEMLDPSESMQNFVHRMSFSKSKGFEATEALNPSDFVMPESQTNTVMNTTQ